MNECEESSHRKSSLCAIGLPHASKSSVLGSRGTPVRILTSPHTCFVRPDQFPNKDKGATHGPLELLPEFPQRMCIEFWAPACHL